MSTQTNDATTTDVPPHHPRLKSSKKRLYACKGRLYTSLGVLTSEPFAPLSNMVLIFEYLHRVDVILFGLVIVCNDSRRRWGE